MKYIKILLAFLLFLSILGFGWFAKSSDIQKSFQKDLTNVSSTGGTLVISSGDVPDIPFQTPPHYVVHVFSSDVNDARDMVFSPGGTLLVSDPNDNQVYALPDTNNDGVADTEKVIISGENHIHGLAVFKGKLYLADVDKVVRYNWDEHDLKATYDKTLFSLPENNDHNNRAITIDNSGNIYVSVGSTCNACKEQSDFSAAVIVSDADGNNPRIFANGLRNAAFITINPKSGELWGTEMGRDYLGDNIPPDEINIIREGLNYGWPDCYGNKIPDTNFNPNATDTTCANTVSPIYEIPAHSAPLGFVFIHSSQFPKDWQGDLLVAYHGSWNRSVPTGYKIVHMKVNGNTITGVEDFMTGFQQGDNIIGRPVDLVFDTKGNLYLSDDQSGVIYIVQKQ